MVSDHNNVWYFWLHKRLHAANSLIPRPCRREEVLSLLHSSLGTRLWTEGLATFPVQLHDTCNVGYVFLGTQLLVFSMETYQ